MYGAKQNNSFPFSPFPSSVFFCLKVHDTVDDVACLFDVDSDVAVDDDDDDAAAVSAATAAAFFDRLRRN